MGEKYGEEINSEAEKGYYNKYKRRNDNVVVLDMAIHSKRKKKSLERLC